LNDHAKQKGEFSMSTEENKAMDRRFFEEVWNRGNLAVVDELMSSDFKSHDPTIAAGSAGFKHFVSLFRAAFPDVHITIEDQLAEGDKVVTRWTARGTHKGDLMGIAPTGKQVTVTGINIGRVEGGKFVEGWFNIDDLGLLQQLGVVPMPG